jgi:hypothetical protein
MFRIYLFHKKKGVGKGGNGERGRKEKRKSANKDRIDY